MKLNLGIDIVEIERIENILSKRRRFLEKIFSPEELEGIDRRKNFARHVAVRFAGKEAVAKAMGTGINGFSFKEVLILSDSKGKPRVELRGKAKEIAISKGISEVAISLSFTKKNAVASAVSIEKE